MLLCGCLQLFVGGSDFEVCCILSRRHMPVQAMVGEHLAPVRCAALRCLGRVLEGVDSLPPSDAKIFNEYDLPHPMCI